MDSLTLAEDDSEEETLVEVLYEEGVPVARVTGLYPGVDTAELCAAYPTTGVVLYDRHGAWVWYNFQGTTAHATNCDVWHKLERNEGRTSLLVPVSMTHVDAVRHLTPTGAHHTIQRFMDNLTSLFQSITSFGLGLRSLDGTKKE